MAATQDGADYGGYAIVTTGGGLQIRTKDGVSDQLHTAAVGALGAGSNPARSLARLGGLAERVFSLNRAFRAFLMRFYGYASRVKGQWHRSLANVAEERKDMRAIAQTAREDSCFASFEPGSKLVVQFGDASGVRAGGAVLLEGAVSAWTAPLPPRVVVQFGSNIKELRRILVQMQRHRDEHKRGSARSVAGGVIFDFTDSQYASDILERGKAETNEGGAILRGIRRICIELKVRLHCFHVAGTRLVENGVDGLSRKEEVVSAQLDLSRWADALAPAPASAAISRLVAQVFGDGRELARRPLKPGQLKGKRWLVMPKPWSAASWAEAAKIAYVMAPMTTDIVFVMPRRAQSLWRRPFRSASFVEVGAVRAGEWDGWGANEHESLHFYHLRAHVTPPKCMDKYHIKHSSPRERAALLRERRRLGPSWVELEQRRFHRAVERPAGRAAGGGAAGEAAKPSAAPAVAPTEGRRVAALSAGAQAARAALTAATTSEAPNEITGVPPELEMEAALEAVFEVPEESVAVEAPSVVAASEAPLVVESGAFEAPSAAAASGAPLVVASVAARSSRETEGRGVVPALHDLDQVRYGAVVPRPPIGGGRLRHAERARQRARLRLDLLRARPVTAADGTPVQRSADDEPILITPSGRRLVRSKAGLRLVAFDEEEYRSAVQLVADLSLTELAPPALLFGDGTLAQGTGATTTGSPATAEATGAGQAPTVRPRPLGVPPGMRKVLRSDNVPYMCDAEGRPFFLTQDGTFYAETAKGRKRPIAFDLHTYELLGEELEELGLQSGPSAALVLEGGELVEGLEAARAAWAAQEELQALRGRLRSL